MAGSMPRDESLVVTDVRCSLCGAVIPKVFARIAVPVANAHRRPCDTTHSSMCRVIVVIDPNGKNHQVHRVPDGVEDRVVMQRVMETIVRPAA